MNWTDWLYGREGGQPNTGGGDAWKDWLYAAPEQERTAPQTRTITTPPTQRKDTEPVFGHYTTPEERAQMNAPQEQGTPLDRAKPPERSLTPLSDAFAKNQGRAIPSLIDAIMGEMGRGLQGAWGQTEGDEMGSVGTGDFLSGIPGLGLPTLAARAASPEINEAFKTPLRDVPVLGGLVRGAEALGGALNAGQEVFGKPTRTALAMMREGNNLARERMDNPLANASHALQQAATGWLLGGDNPDIFKAGGTTPEEFDQLFGGFWLNQNTPEQNKRLETVLNLAAPQEAEKNPISSAVYESMFDPLTYLDIAAVLPKMSAIQGMRRAYGAAGDVTDAGRVVGAGGNPLETLLYKMAQPKSVKAGEIISEKAAGIVRPADTTVLARALNAFKKNPIGQTIDNTQRAIGSIGPFLTDVGRSLDDKMKFLQALQPIARSKQIPAEVLAQMKALGIPNSPDMHTLMHALGTFDAKGTTEGYQRAMSQVRGLEERMASRATRSFNPQVASDVRAATEGSAYGDVFDRLLKGWENGELDVQQLKEGVENVAGLQLTADLTEHLAANLAHMAGIKAPNVITSFVNRMKNLQGMLYISGNPASLVNNSLNDMFTGLRHGAGFRTEAQLDEAFARWGMPYNDAVGDTTRGAINAKRGVTNESEGVRSAYGTSVPQVTDKIPGIKQLNQWFQKNQLWHRKVANLTGRFRSMAQNHNPKLSPVLAQYYGAQAGELEGMLRNALNRPEARKILTGDKITWAKFKRQFAEEITDLLEPLAKRKMGITEDSMKDALSLSFMDNLDRALEDMYAAVAKGEDALTAFKRARGKWFGDDLFGEGTSGAPTPKPPSSPSGGGTGMDPLEKFWNNVPSAELNRMGKAQHQFLKNYKRAPTVAELEDMLAGRNPAPDIAPTQPRPAQAPEPRKAEGGQGGTTTGLDMGEPRNIGGNRDIVGDSPVRDGGVANPVINDIRTRAAAITEPTIKRDLLREWDALFHEGEAENVQRATQKSVNNWSEEVFLEKAKSIVGRAREKGQTWITTMADMFEDRAHYLIEQMAAGNPKYNTPEYIERVANGDALVRLLRGGENGFDWTKFDTPYEYRPYESFAQYRRRVTDEFIDRELIGQTGDTGVGTASAGTGSAARTGDAVGAVGGGDVVTPRRVQNAVDEPARGLGRLDSKDDAWWEWMGIKKPKSGKIKIYRGVSSEKGTMADEIRAGDWVTLNKKQAREMYAFRKGDKILEMEVPLSDIDEASTNTPRSMEFYYTPQRRAQNMSDVQLRGIDPDEMHTASRPLAQRRNANDVPPPTEGNFTLSGGEPQPLDDMGYLNAQKFRDSARKMAEDAANFTDPRLNREAMDALDNVLLDRVEQELANGLPARGQLPPHIEAEIDRYLDQEFMPELNGLKAAANAAGRFFQDSTVLNYDGAWNIETALLLERPFVHWWLHSALNYSRDFLDHPAMLAFMLRLTNNIYAESNRLVDEGVLPKRYRDRVRVSLPFQLPGNLGNTLWVNPLRLAFPYEDVLQLNAKERAQYQTVKEDGTLDPSSIVNDTFGIHTPYVLAYNALTGDPDEFWSKVASLPALRMFRAGTGIGLESEYDRSYYERAIKELISDRVLTEDQANVALLEQGNNPDWLKIKQRANLENYTVREVSALTGLRGMAFTPGEQKYYESKRAKEEALRAAVQRYGGNPDMDTDTRHKFFTDKGYYKSDEYQQLREQYPELNTLIGEGYDEEGKPLPMDEAQEKRYRAYLVDKTWGSYHDMPELKQKLFAVGLGEEFEQKFMKDKAYDDIPIETLEGIAQMAEVELLNVAGMEPTKPQAFKMAFTTPAQDKAYQALYDEVQQAMGWQEYAAGWDKYYALKDQSKEQARAFLNSPEGKQLIAVSDRIDEFYTDNPDVARLLEQQGLKKPEVQTAPSDPRGAALNQQVMAAGLNWDTINRKQDEYNALKTKEEKAAYRARNPDLLQYWNIRDSIYGNTNQRQESGWNQTRTVQPQSTAPRYGPTNAGKVDYYALIAANNALRGKQLSKQQQDPRVLWRQGQ